ncbi:unnamed protein product [Mytilus coruscus]|uniref:Myb/SANT-like DNA-binding domain-containing protein n=1 Tax=Mytilus coruscus TaxID=42192 RepID=A0A6J8F597_MYTCO|nr:unnamed protein product [Mytilus coruscus]
MALPKLFRKTQMRFSAKDNLILLKEVLAENPYKDKAKWEAVAQNVKENVEKVFNVTSRRVRERTQLLLQQFQKENYEALKSEGVTVTPCKITKIKGNESIMSYLKEKCDVEKEIKMEEVNLRKEELKLKRERLEIEREERRRKIENDKQQQLLLMELIKTVKKILNEAKATAS